MVVSKLGPKSINLSELYGRIEEHFGQIGDFDGGLPPFCVGRLNER